MKPNGGNSASKPTMSFCFLAVWVVSGVSAPVWGGIVLLGAAGDEGQAQHEGERKRDELFHGLDSSAFRFSVML